MLLFLGGAPLLKKGWRKRDHSILTRRLSPGALLLLFLCSASLFDSIYAFAPQPPPLSPIRRSIKNIRSLSSATALYDNNDNDNNNVSLLLERFTNPIIDDKLLPLTEAGIAQIIAPTIQLFLVVAVAELPYPSWATPFYYDTTFFATPRGAFLAPTLAHGAGLACCWLAGCLAAKAWEKTAYEGTFQQVLRATIKAGAFASGLLILATQFDLYKDMDWQYVTLGESPETDILIIQHTKELIADITTEAVVFVVWRIFRRKRFDEDYFGRKL